MTITTDVIIVGGGLSGLALASHLQSAGITYQLIEARPRLGGRIKSASFDLDEDHAACDLGPSWFWPGQWRMEKLVETLELSVFEQYAEGEQRLENAQGKVFQNQGYASMQGSLRIAGGIYKIIEGLCQSLAQDTIHLNTKFVEAYDKTSHIEVRTCATEDAHNIRGKIFHAQRLVLALPPRVANTLSFEPSLPGDISEALNEIPTWMAGQAKAIARYKTPFWRAQGLSGDAMSQQGPLVEIHDACDPGSSQGILFGFIGVPAQIRLQQPDAIKTAIEHQLVRLFGEQAATPLQLYIQDWAGEKYTATTADLRPPQGHPTYGLPEKFRELWEGRLLFGSTETAPQFGGYLEGALEAAENTAQIILTKATEENSD